MSEWLNRNRQRNQSAGTPPIPDAPAAPAAPIVPEQAPRLRISSDWLIRARKAASERGSDRVMSTTDADLLRILSLPVIPYAVARCPDREAYAKSLYNHAKPGEVTLRDVQADAAYTFENQGGLLAPIGVGFGKTLITIVCGKIGLERRGHMRAVLLVPPQVLDQLVHRDLPQLRKWLSLDNVPIYTVSGDRATRMRIAQQPGRAIFLYTYSSLSAQTGYDELAAMCPTLFILDEAHLVSRANTTRTKRLLSVISVVEQALQDGRMGREVTAKSVEGVVLSGTITRKKISDYAHLARLALKDQSPTPIKESSITVLGSVIDAETTGAGLSALDQERARQLIEWATAMSINPGEKVEKKGLHATFQEKVRESFQFRLRSAPGVVATSDASVDCSLYISWSEPPRPRTPEAERMAEIMKKVVRDQITPDGDTIDFGMHTFKWLYELSSGFYNSLIWPLPEDIQKSSAHHGKKITENESIMLLEQAKSQHALKQVYHKELRRFLDYQHTPGCDSPMLVGLELTRQLEGKAAKHPLPRGLVETYREQKAAWYEDLPERIGKPVRICDYKILAAVEWAKQHVDVGGIVWVHHPEIMVWLHERLEAASVPHTMAMAGDNESPYASGVVVASFAHCTGKNLQHQSHNLFLEIRREASIMEQAIGRTHRAGQKADDVRVDVFISSGFDLALFNATMRDADYIQSTTGQAQRLCYACYAPVIPPSNPRLAVRLGIIKSVEDARSVDVKAYDAITPPEALSLEDIFRSVRASGSKPDDPLTY
jgi:hypothetical protein